MKLSRIIPMLIVAMFAFSGVMYFLLPDDVPTHWNAAGEVDDTSPKLMAVLIMPVLSVVLWRLLTIVPKIDPRREAYEQFAQTYQQVVVGIMFFMALIHVATLFGTWQEDVVPYVIAIGVSALFILIGNVMGRTRANYFFGFRTPWTLSSDRVWRKSNRMMGRIFVIVGILTILSVLINPSLGIGVLLISILIGAIGGTVYSYLLYRSEMQEANTS